MNTEKIMKKPDIQILFKFNASKGQMKMQLKTSGRDVSYGLSTLFDSEGFGESLAHSDLLEYKEKKYLLSIFRRYIHYVELLDPND